MRENEYGVGAGVYFGKEGRGVVSTVGRLAWRAGCKLQELIVTSEGSIFYCVYITHSNIKCDIKFENV